MEEYCLLDCLQPHSLQWGWALLYQLATRKMPPETCLQAILMEAVPHMRSPLPRYIKLSTEANHYTGSDAPKHQNRAGKILKHSLWQSNSEQIQELRERMGLSHLVAMVTQISKLSHQKPWDSQLKALRRSVMSGSSGYCRFI